MFVQPRLRPAFLAVLVLVACRAESAHQSAAPRSEREPRFAVAPATPLAVRSAPFDVEHYALDIDLDPATRTMHATCNVRLWATSSALSEVELDLAGLDVESVHDRDGNALAFEHAGETLRIHLARPCEPRAYVELAIRYGGHPKKGLWFVREKDGAPTQVFTQGECRDAHWWFPCFDEPAERATSELRVTMPSSWRSVACGERIERVEMGGRASELWRMTSPHPAYLESLVAGDLAFDGESWTGVPLEFVAAPDLEPYLRPTLQETAPILDFFSAITGARYPYAKYAQCCVDDFPFGGMENISATTLIDSALLDERGLLDTPGAPLVAHEAAHQWFGDLLTCKDWSQAWLNEGFATYMAALYTEKSRGADAFRLEMQELHDAYTSRDTGANRRPIVYGVCRDPLQLFMSGHVYQGAAVRLHLLRSVIGDEAFFAGLKVYVGTNRDRAVVTDDVRVAMETASKRDLRGFFDQWFAKPGFPELHASWSFDASPPHVTLVIEQLQAGGGGTPEVFRTPIDVEIRAGGRTRTQRIELDRRSQSFELETSELPTWVRVDPHGCVPKRLDETKSEREWVAIAEACDDVCGRRDALRVLAAQARRSSVAEERERVAQLLADRLAGDPCGDVRAAAAEGLVGLQIGIARPALLACADHEVDLHARSAALRALAAIGADAELADLARRVRASAPSWNVFAAASGLLGAAAPKAAYDELVADIDVPSPHGVRKARVLSEIVKLKDERVLALCARLASDVREPDAVRIIAVQGLAVRGRGNADVRRELLALLDTDRWRLRRELIPALGALNDPAARARLERWWSETPFDSEKRQIEAVLETSAAGA